MQPLGLLDGKIIDLTENILPMEDRGHQFGDGVYEVTRVYKGQCFALEAHMERLYRSLRELRIPATYSFEELAGFHELLIKESGIMEGAIYLQITRGVSPRAHGFPEQVIPRLTMSIRPTTALTALKANGAKVALIPDERWLRCDIKSINLLGNILGKQKAKEAGCFEGVMIRDGLITEGTSSNFFVIKDGVLWTHPVSNLILKGVTRTLVIEKIVPELGFMVLEKAFTPDFLKTVEEAFVCGTNTEIVPVVTIDGAPVGNGTVGPVCRKIQQAYDRLIDEQCNR